MPVVLAERDRITQYIERNLRCACGKRLRYSKVASSQVRSAALPWLSPASRCRYYWCMYLCNR